MVRVVAAAVRADAAIVEVGVGERQCCGASNGVWSAQDVS